MSIVFADYDWEKEHPGVKRSENHLERKTISRPDGKLILYIDISQNWYCLAGAKPSTLDQFIADAEAVLAAYSTRSATCVWGDTKERGKVGFKEFKQPQYRRILPKTFYLNTISPMYIFSGEINSDHTTRGLTMPFHVSLAHPQLLERLTQEPLTLAEMKKIDKFLRSETSGHYSSPHSWPPEVFR